MNPGNPVDRPRGLPLASTLDRRTSKKKLKRIVSLLLVLLSTVPARADLVTVVATGTLTEFSDPQGLLPFSETDAAGGFTLSFTYRDDIQQYFPGDPSFDLYFGAIQSMQMVVGTVVVSLWSNGFIVVSNDAESTMPGYHIDYWLASTQQREPLGNEGHQLSHDMSLFLLQAAMELPVPPLYSDALVPPPWPHDWTEASIRYLVDEFDAWDNRLGTLASAEAGIESVSVTSSAVPLPAAAWLFPTAFGAVALRARRRAGGRAGWDGRHLPT